MIGGIFSTATRPALRHLSLVTALTAGALSLLVVYFMLGLGQYNLSIPISYGGDALYETVMVKALTEGSWNYHIARLGAPFELDAVDFPIGCNLDFAIMKLLFFVISNPFTLINSYWLLTIAMAAAFSALLFRSLEISPLYSATFGTLYATIPFVFYRNISHLNLVHFIVPAGAYLGLVIARGACLTRSSTYKAAAYVLTRSQLFLCLFFCAAVGFAYSYWAFFSCIVVAAGSLVGTFQTKSKQSFLLGALFISVIFVSALANVSASLVYWHAHGSNKSLNYKYPAEADIYGLRIRQMLTPIPEHPLPALRAFRERILKAAFPNDTNESSAASLGTIGTIGLLLLLTTSLCMPSGRVLGGPRMRILAALTLALILIAVVGGFGSIFNLLIVHEFRAYNRLSPFVSLFSLGACALFIDQLLPATQAFARYCAAAGLVFTGAFDQVPTATFRGHPAVEALFKEDRAFIRKLETVLPKGSTIFQLPYTSFPPDGQHHNMGPYAHARAYLHSANLRWSWGAMQGRNHAWTEATAALPLPQFLRRIVEAGFTGILLDRDAYTDSSVETAIRQLCGSPDKVEPGRSWVYLDLHPLVLKYLGNLSDSEIKEVREDALHPIWVDWQPDFSVEEESAEKGTWRWCGKRGVIRFINDSAKDREVTTEAAVQKFGDGIAQLSIERAGEKRTLSLAADPVRYTDRFIVPAHSDVAVQFEFEGHLLAVPTDPRQLAFQVRNFRYY